MKPNPSDAMNARQGARTGSGRYEKMNQCELCPKRLGDYAYFSLGMGGSSEMEGRGVVLCRKCGAKLEKLPMAEALEMLKAEDARRAEVKPCTE